MWLKNYQVHITARRDAISIAREDGLPADEKPHRG